MFFKLRLAENAPDVDDVDDAPPPPDPPAGPSKKRKRRRTPPPALLDSETDSDDYERHNHKSLNKRRKH